MIWGKKGVKWRQKLWVDQKKNHTLDMGVRVVEKCMSDVWRRELVEKER
jgi:hypothetical protein